MDAKMFGKGKIQWHLRIIMLNMKMVVTILLVMVLTMLVVIKKVVMIILRVKVLVTVVVVLNSAGGRILCIVRNYHSLKKTAEGNRNFRDKFYSLFRSVLNVF